MENSVTVCIATFNRATSLQNAILSIQAQTYHDFEILVVDDGSTDNTEEVVLSYQGGDKRVSYLKHTKNKGLAAARNTAIKAASGRFFTFLDDDDSWDSGFIEEFLQLASKYDDKWCFCCGSVYVGMLGEEIHYLCNLNGSLKEYFAAGFTPPVAGQFYFTKTLRMIGGYNEAIKSGVDHDLWLRLAVNGIQIKSLDKALSHPNTNFSQRRMTTNFERRIQGLSNSLSIWKPTLKTHFGSPFYETFCEAYLRSEKRSFFYNYLLHLRIFDAFAVYKSISSDISFRALIGIFKIIVLRIFGVKINKTYTKYAGPYLQIRS